LERIAALFGAAGVYDDVPFELEKHAVSYGYCNPTYARCGAHMAGVKAPEQQVADAIKNISGVMNR